jgi:hypothetical protein
LSGVNRRECRERGKKRVGVQVGLKGAACM